MFRIVTNRKIYDHFHPDRKHSFSSHDQNLFFSFPQIAQKLLFCNVYYDIVRQNKRLFEYKQFTLSIFIWMWPRMLFILACKFILPQTKFLSSLDPDSWSFCQDLWINLEYKFKIISINKFLRDTSKEICIIINHNKK